MMSLNLHSKQLSLEQQARPSFHWKWLEAIKGLSGVPPAPNTKDALTLFLLFLSAVVRSVKTEWDEDVALKQLHVYE